MKTTLRDPKGKIVGYLDKQPNGNVIATDFYGKLKATYNKKENMTRDFYGRLLAVGDITSGILYSNQVDQYNQKINYNLGKKNKSEKGSK